MRNLTVVFLLAAVPALVLYAGTQPATLAEVEASLKTVREAVRQGDDEALSVYREAMEIEKRATHRHWADAIGKKMAMTAKIPPVRWESLRGRFSFFDLAIGWAISQEEAVAFSGVMEKKGTRPWKDVLAEYSTGVYRCRAKDLADRIRQLNPPKN